MAERSVRRLGEAGEPLLRLESVDAQGQQLGRDGFLHESAMRFLLSGNTHVELGRFLRSGHACLGLFAAADALGVGFVKGVPPHVYVDRPKRHKFAAMEAVVPAEKGEVPDLILRQAPAPQSIFRGLVLAQDRPTSDVLQVWLDVASHPTRGAEQAEQIRRKVLAPLLEGRTVHA